MIPASELLKTRRLIGFGKDHSDVDRPALVFPVSNGDQLLADELVNVPVRLLARLRAVAHTFAGAAFLRGRAAAHAALDVGVRGLMTTHQQSVPSSGLRSFGHLQLRLRLVGRNERRLVLRHCEAVVVVNDGSVVEMRGCRGRVTMVGLKRSRGHDGKWNHVCTDA